jgi:toxin ParE1/3/4
MARESKPSGQRLVIHTAASRADLISIYVYNDMSYGEAHAERYIDFLNGEMQELADEPTSGNRIEAFPDTLVYLAKTRARISANGYRIFYRLVTDGIEIIRILHTRMDWPIHLAESEL